MLIIRIKLDAAKLLTKTSCGDYKKLKTNIKTEKDNRGKIMWETEYAREPINYRLFFLKMLKKIWMLPLSALAGGLIIGGIYYVVNMVIGDGYIYRARTIYHIEYAQDGDGVEKEYYNYFTFKQWGHASSYDLCIDSSRVVGEAGVVEQVKLFMKQSKMI